MHYYQRLRLASSRFRDFVVREEEAVLGVGVGVGYRRNVWKCRRPRPPPERGLRRPPAFK